jgi:hypothetical protein
MSRLQKMKSLAIKMLLPAPCAMALAVAGTATCLADEKEAPNEARAERAAELDTKVAVVKKQFDALKTKLTDASEQAKANLTAELDTASSDLAKAYDERETVFEDRISKWSESLDAKWKELEQQGQLTKAEAARKLAELRQSWTASYEQLRQSHQERVEHYREELTSIEKQVATTADALNAEWIARRTAARKKYEETAAAMRESYRESIASLQKEIDRLRAGAKQAGDENKAKFAALADSLSEQMNVLHQELQTSFRETADKANRYLAQTEAKLAKAGAEVKGKIQEETEQVSNAACELNAEMAACCEQYHQSLDQQLAFVNERAATAKGKAKKQLSELETDLRIQSETASRQVDEAYASYVAALNRVIDHMKERLSDANEKTRAKMVEVIERRQAELETAKQKLPDE